MPETETKRLFVAIFPPAEILTSLQPAIARLTQAFAAHAIRWTRPEQIHLTVHFLGAMASTRVPEIQSALAAACDGHQRHPVRVRGLGCFPNPARPRIIWAGLTGDLRPLERLKKSIDAAFLASGCAEEDRPFHPHLTLGRVAQLNSPERRKLADTLVRDQDLDFGQWQIEKIELMQSQLSPQGAAYSALKAIPLDIP